MVNYLSASKLMRNSFSKLDIHVVMLICLFTFDQYINVFHEMKNRERVIAMKME